MIYKTLKLKIGKVTAASLGPHLASAGIQTRPVAAMIEQKAIDFLGLKCLIGIDVKPDKTFEVEVLRQQSSTLLLRRFPTRTASAADFLEFVKEVPQELLREPLLPLLTFGREPGSPLERCLRGTALSMRLKLL